MNQTQKADIGTIESRTPADGGAYGFSCLHFSFLLLLACFFLPALPGCTAATPVTNLALTRSEPSLYELDNLYADPANYKQPNIFLSYTVVNHRMGKYTRNTNCWAYPVDLTPLAVAISHGGTNYPPDNPQCKPTLISPLHTIHATHCGPGVGTWVRFVTRQNAVVDRYVTSLVDLGDDVRVCRLNAAVTNCGFARFFDTASFSNRLLIVTNGMAVVKKIPLLSHNQGGWAYTQSPSALVTSGTNCHLNFSWTDTVYPANSDPVTWRPYPTITNRHHFFPTGGSPCGALHGLSGGDSSHGVFAVLTNQLVILTAYTACASGRDYTTRRASIDAAMTRLGGGHVTTTCPLPEYVPDLYR